MLWALNYVKPRQQCRTEPAWPRLRLCSPPVVLYQASHLLPKELKKKKILMPGPSPQTSSLRIVGLGSDSGYLVKLSRWF